MTEVNKEIIRLINENKNMKEISQILNISLKQLYVRIKQIIEYGYVMRPSYSYSSDIYYKIQKNINEQKNTFSLKVPSHTQELRLLVISDIHVGNEDCDIKLLNTLYEYAINNKINIILFCGDMIENVYSSDKKSISDIDKQIETLIKKYPYDENILNIGILGNHEYYSLIHDGFNIIKKITTSRYDIIPIGYGSGLINIKDDYIFLKHRLTHEKPEEEIDAKIVLSGHGHMMKTKINDKFCLCVPTLSHVFPDKTKTAIPGFIDLTLIIENNKFKSLYASHMIISDKIYKASESSCEIKKLVKQPNTEEKFNKNKKN